MKAYGVCSNNKCGKWGEAPADFNESKHFLKCGECNSPMFLDYTNPTVAGYREQDKVTVGLMKAPKH